MSDYDCVLASLAVEGVTPSEEAQKLSKKYLGGTITSNAVIEKILRMYGVMTKCKK